ncbi:MAG TPA: hypothetical protein VGI74_15240 [Streptosporangiaceae bacterium]
MSSGDPDELRHRAWQWVNSDALRAVLDAFGAEAEGPGNLPKLLEWSAQHLDTRAGGERHEARPAEYTPEQIRTLRQAAGPLGLLRTAAPSQVAYDLTIVLGGTVTGNEVRVGFTFSLSNPGFDFGELVGVGGHRQLSSPERRLALDDGAVPPAQQDEYEHLAWVLHRFSSADKRRVLRSEGEPSTFSSWQIEVLEQDRRAVAYLARAPSRRPGRRADTLDAVLFARKHLGTGTGSTLIVTSSIYTPYSFFLLGPHASPSQPIEVLGTPTAHSDQPDRQAQRFAQEIHATLAVLPL